MSVEPYRDYLEHMADEFDRLLLLLRSRCLLRVQGSLLPELLGLHVSAAEAQQLLAQNLNPFATPEFEPAAVTEADNPQALARAWRDRGQHIAARRQASRAAGVFLPLERLNTVFDLNAFEEFLLLLTLAPEVNPTIGRLYAFLQRDINWQRPTVKMALDWLGLDAAGLGLARTQLDEDAPLLHFRLLRRTPLSAPLLEQQLYLSERIVRFLLGVPALDPALRDMARLSRPEKTDIADPLLPLLELIDDQDHGSLICYLYGSYGSGRQQLAERLAAQFERPLLIIDGFQLASDADAFADTLGRMRRELRLQRSFLFVEHAQYLLQDAEPYADMTRRFFQSATGSSPAVFLAGTDPWQPRGYLNRYAFVSWPIHVPDFNKRFDLWYETAAGTTLAPDVNLEELASRFRFTGGQIADAWRIAFHQARLRRPDEPEVAKQDLYYGAHGQAVHQLSQMAELVKSVHTWDDLILPDEPLSQLRELSSRARHLQKVYYEWGFSRKLSTNRGIVALFTGTSGTGKTMAASILAHDLGLEMYRVDLSAVVSKYVGETEKNLSRIFDEAWRSNAIIFFDEADALFGKRSEVRDSHDRYANIEVNYLLQRLDTFDGIAILATNLGQNIDDAFQRRIQFTINFPETDEYGRYGIWTTIWPEETPLADDIDFRFLANSFRFNGGNIRNVVLQAAFLAAPNGSVVSMKHILQAVLREFRKGGKLVSRSDFGRYADLLDWD